MRGARIDVRNEGAILIYRILFGLAIFAGATTCAYADGVANAVGYVFRAFCRGERYRMVSN